MTLGDMKTLRPFVLLVTALVVIPAFTSCRPSPESVTTPANRPAIPVRIGRAESKPYRATEEVVGTVQAKLRAVIEAKISGRIEKMLVAPGQFVKAGDLLVQLDAREIQARLDQAVTTRDQSGRDTERLRTLLANNSVSRQEFETV